MDFDRAASDENLARWLKEGHHKAFDELMTRYKGRLHAFICRYIADREEAYDLLQECFISIYRKIDLYDPDRRFSTWAFQIALNKCRDWGRKNGLRRLLTLSSLNNSGDGDNFLENIADPGASPEHALINKRELERLAKAVSELPDKLKSPLIMCVLNSMPQDECAAILGVTRKTVETRIYRARRKLADLLP